MKLINLKRFYALFGKDGLGGRGSLATRRTSIRFLFVKGDLERFELGGVDFGNKMVLSVRS